MEVVVSVAAKIAEYTFVPILCPIVRPIARPLKPLWEYKKNLQRLKKKIKKLERKSEDVQRSINFGVDPPMDVKAWLDNVTEISNKVYRLPSEQQNMNCCCNLKRCYQHRKNVAKTLEDAGQLYCEAMDSKDSWEYKINIQNLKKKVEDLMGKRESLQNSIKDGEEASSHVQKWEGKVNNIIQEVAGLIDTSQQNFQCCERFICLECFQRKENVAHKVRDMAELLQEARGFREVSRMTEETIYKKNLQNLKKEVETLKLKENDVRRRIKVGEEPLAFVKNWQGDVKKITDEVSGLAGEYNHEEHNRVAAMLEEVIRLLQKEAQFTVVSYRPPPEQINFQSTTQQIFESRRSILEDIIENLRNADVNMVGTYGTGGVGKTTLAKRVGYQVMLDKVFSMVIFAEVTQSPDIKTIQGTIADGLGLKFEEETTSGRARKLYVALKKEEEEQIEEHKKILIILDNLWTGIKLEDVGIPFGKDCKKIKLLLTSRSRDVLTNEMESRHNFYMEVLNEAEA